MKNVKSILCLLMFTLNSFLVAQSMPKPAAQNAWEEIYVRISESYSPVSLLELLKSMELESDQDSLASSYAIILKDHIHRYTARSREDAGYAERVLAVLLDKVDELAEVTKQQNPEVANVIAITLIPELDYNSAMGKANLVLGSLDAIEFAPEIIRRLQDINNIMLDGGHTDWTGLNYSAMGCLQALRDFALPESLPVLYQVMHGSFNQAVRNQARSILNQLLGSQGDEVQAQFSKLVEKTQNLVYLEILANSMETGDLKLSDKTLNEINLALLKRMNNVTWTPKLHSENVKHEIVRKTVNNFLVNGAGDLSSEVTEQLRNSYDDSGNFNLKLQTLQAIGKLKSEDGLKFLQSEILRLNVLQRSDSVDYSDERLLRQLVYALRISGDSSAETISVLRDITITPYSAQVRQLAKGLIADLS